MFALKGKVRKEDALPMCPPGTEYIMTPKGYFDDLGFFEYIKFLVRQLPKDGKWRVLIFDGYGAHTMVKSTLDYLVANRIYACCMYAIPCPSFCSNLISLALAPCKT